ncbi:hypothetical protein F53441_5411 [Fusarium austroafricanum]|uniref:Uncharacterized protein n=1 Tax=Fusarium austroafricanum TaxID=2364996 RepID=A0A8H4KIC1_9HYPO|nr:hypothetical protein F53441_5411 [Fusarium austroafricanum]
MIGQRDKYEESLKLIKEMGDNFSTGQDWNHSVNYLLANELDQDDALAKFKLFGDKMLVIDDKTEAILKVLCAIPDREKELKKERDGLKTTLAPIVKTLIEHRLPGWKAEARLLLDLSPPVQEYEAQHDSLRLSRRASLYGHYLGWMFEGLAVE